MKEERLTSKFTFVTHADITGSPHWYNNNEGLPHNRIQGTFRRLELNFTIVVCKL